MTISSDDSFSRVRRSIYWILIAVAVGNMSGRILAVNSIDTIRQEAARFKEKIAEKTKRLEDEGVSGDALEVQVEAYRQELAVKDTLQRPFLSGNDRSRWDTVRSLVEFGTYEIDDVVSQRNWDTIDMVKHKNRTGEARLYSSKPPLLATLIAGPYWIVTKTTGATLETHPYEIGRSFLLVINVIPLVLMYLAVASIAERYGATDWGRMFIVAAATLATFLNTFAVVLNNHLPAAVSVALALDATLRICVDGDRRWRWFWLAGFMAAFAVTNELPALSFASMVTVSLLWKAPRQTLVGFATPALFVAGAFFGTNYIAHASFRPPYDHWDPDNKEDNWYHYTYMRDGREIESYWIKPQGIDKGEKSTATYALHCLVGHHGLFSLTPLWLLSFLGLGMWFTRGGQRELQLAAAAILIISVVVFVFYLLRPDMQRNYGGMTSGLRWMFWFAPLWLFGMIPAADWLARSRFGRGVGLVLLAFSVLAASFPTWNPWTQPYLARFFEYLGWVKF